MTIDLSKAIHFVQKNGSDVEVMRLKFYLGEQGLPETEYLKIFADQHEDGGWAPKWLPGYSSPNATCYRLAQAEQLGINKSQIQLQKAIHFLMQHQAPDGSWEEANQASEAAPPWAQPGVLAAQLYLTANCGFWVAYYGNPENRGAEAAGFLHSYLDSHGHFPSYLHTHWLATGLWHLLEWEPPKKLVLEYLESRINDLAPSHLAWMITTFLAAGMPATFPLVSRSASMLAEQQQPDGNWQSEDGPGFDVPATLEALYALEHSGSFGNPEVL
jgi:hypothetical protein